jgi:hypothetical protein
MKRVLIFIGWAVCWLLQAVLLIYFAPVIFQDMFSGQWDRRKREIARITRIKERFADDRWLWKENKKRRKRKWKTRNNFYK